MHIYTFPFPLARESYFIKVFQGFSLFLIGVYFKSSPPRKPAKIGGVYFQNV